MRLSEVAGGRNNNFNLIRMIAATGVLFSHAFPIALGSAAIQPLKLETGYALGWICVAVFFAISGFLITRSFDRTAQFESWFAARVARLFPALIVVCLLTAFLYGPAFTTLGLGEYFQQPATWTYAPRNIALAKLQFGLPGVFADHPYPVAINGSLWTLFHEVACYFGVFLAGIAGALRSRRLFALLAALYLVAFLATGMPQVAERLPERVAAFRLLSFPFFVGMVFYLWRERIALSWVAAAVLGGAAWLARGTLLYEATFLLFIAYATFVVAYRPGGVLRRYNDLGDYSYGMYVYAFPVQQAAVALAGPMDPLTNIAWSLPFTLVLAVLSWYLVESPSLERRHRLAELLGRFRRRSNRVGDQDMAIVENAPTSSHKS